MLGGFAIATVLCGRYIEAEESNLSGGLLRVAFWIWVGFHASALSFPRF
jgi:hypothetical protein